MHKINHSSYLMEKDYTKILEPGCDFENFPHVSDRYFWRSISGENENLLNETPRISNYNHSLYLNLERRVSCSPSRSTISNETSSPKTTKELVKEITTLEIEIVQLEHNLLSLYRTAFDCYVNDSSNISNKYSRHSLSGMLTQKNTPQMGNYAKHGFQSAPHKEINCSVKCSDSDNIVSYVSGHNAKKDMLKVGYRLCNTIQLEDTNLNPASIDPCKLSEEIIRCIASIYCKIANVPESQQDKANFSVSSLSFSSSISQQSCGENWSPRYRHDASASTSSSKIDDKLCSDLIEIPNISVDGERFGYASKMLSIFRGLIKQLKSVDPRKMTYQEQIAFWLNIHNSLIMHAFLAYGLHQGGMKRKVSILKAAYNIGGHSINAYAIQSSILCCHPHFSASWLEVLLCPSLTFMKRRQKHCYALLQPQPLVHFALCQGAYSDPPLRVYSEKHIMRDLEHARKEFIQANIKAKHKTKISLPKILSYYMKDCAFDLSKLLKMMNECMTEDDQCVLREFIDRRADDCIVWLKYDLRFRYMISSDMASQ